MTKHRLKKIDIKEFFLQNKAPIYFISKSAYNLLGADHWINNLRFINTVDSFDGQHSHCYVPDDVPSKKFACYEDHINFLLENNGVIQFLNRNGENGKALFTLFDEQSETLAEKLGLQICFPRAALRQHLDNKLTTTRLASKAGIKSVPYVLTQVRDYETLCCVAAHLGPDWVVQLPYGDSGTTTFFISIESDFKVIEEQISQAPEVKIMRKIRCHQATIEGCVSRHGILIAPLMAELVGFPELTSISSSWCGNELVHDSFNLDIRLQAQHIVRTIGEALREEGYKGYFGLDLLLDEETNKLYLGELNPRITGATLLTSQAAINRGEIPLLLYHLLEWLEVDYEIDLQSFNQQWLHLGTQETLCQMLIKQLDNRDTMFSTVPSSGIWRLDEQGAISFIRPEYYPGTVLDKNEVLFIRTIDTGQQLRQGTSLGRLVSRGRFMQADFQLSKKSKLWVEAFRSLFR